MKNLSIIILMGLLLGTAPTLKAYEISVHARITNEAYKKSVLVDPKFLKRFDLETEEEPFGIKY